MLFRSTASVFEERWPEYDPSKLVQDTVEIALQVNGKLRGTMEIAMNEDKDSVLTRAKELLESKFEGKSVVKEIYVPNKIANFIVK